MVAGKQRVLRAAKPVKLVEKRRVKVGGRRCTVAGATPLGVLAGTSLALRVRDYGSCGRRAGRRRAAVRDAHRRRAQPRPGRLGLQGRPQGRPRPGRATAPAGACAAATGCCGSTAARSAPAAASARSRPRPTGPPRRRARRVRVTVRGYDDQGRGVAVPGATVRLGSATATTGRGRRRRSSPSPAAGRLALDRDARRHGRPRSRGEVARRMRRALAIASLLAALAAAGSGCGLGPGEEQASEGSLTVTRDFGAEPLGRKHGRPACSDSDTVMRLLQRDFEVETRYGGNFVQEIDGVAGGREGGRRVDWFYYVNGIESGVGRGRAAVAARRPDLVGPPRLERHDARPRRGRLLPRAVRAPAARAASSRSGSSASATPARACDEVETRLRDAGITDTARSVLEQSAGREVLRVLVGPWSQVRRDTAARKLEGGPGRVGRLRAARRRPATGSTCSTTTGASCARSARAAACSPRRGSRPSSRPGSSPASTPPASPPRPRR